MEPAIRALLRTVSPCNLGTLRKIPHGRPICRSAAGPRWDHCLGSKPESQPVQPGLHLGAGHEEAPEQAGAVVFHHDHDGALVDGEVPGFAPPVMEAEAVVESVRALDPMAEVVVEMPEGSQAFPRGVGEG